MTLVDQQRPDGVDLLTVVLEDYFQVAPLKSVIRTAQWYRFESRVEANTLKTLDLLDELGARATFFVVGWIADEVPELIREVVRRGHEVASKGYYHRCIRQLTPDEFRDDLLRSREALEKASGSPVLGYRIAYGGLAPADLWALDVLAQEGFAYDSSLRPTWRLYAHEPWRRFVHGHRCGDVTLWELPLSTFSLGGWCLPIAGGNYLRQLPHSVMHRAVARWHRTYDSPFLFYFHVWELDPDQPRINGAPPRQRIRQYRNLDKMPEIVRHYLSRYRFLPIRDYLGLEAGPLRREVQEEARAVAGIIREEIQPPPATPTGVRQPRVRGPRAGGRERRERVTLVVPCYNEEGVLPYLANTLGSVGAALGTDYELAFLFVDDGSGDGTWACLQRLFGSRPDCALVRHGENRGVAAAILNGLRRAETEIVCSIDCDCTYDPHQLRSLIPLLAEGVDLVTASPYHPEGRVRNVPAWRLFLSRSLSRLYGLVLHQRLATYTSCFRVYRRSAMTRLPVREGGFLGVAEMLGLLDLAGGRIVECPAVLEARLLGRSKMKIARTCAGHLGLLARLARLRWSRRRISNGARERTTPVAPPGADRLEESP